MKTKQLDKQLATYSATAGAVLAGATVANAGIIYTAVDLTYSGNDDYIDVDGSDLAIVRFSHNFSTNTSGGTYSYKTTASGGSSSVWVPGDTFISEARGQVGVDYGGRVLETSSSGNAKRIAFGQAIGAANNSWGYGGDLFRFSNYYGSTSSVYGNFSAANTGYIGFRFDPDNHDAPTDWKYGWVHIDNIADDFSSFHISGYAYEDSGDPIAAGAVPEPSSLALLALGAAGLRSIRRFNRPGA